jgi:hypothetical protein
MSELNIDLLQSVEDWRVRITEIYNEVRADFSGSSNLFRADCREEFAYTFAALNQQGDCREELSLLNNELKDTCRFIVEDTFEADAIIHHLANDVTGLLYDALRRFDAEFTGWPRIRVITLRVWKSTFIRAYFDVSFDDFGLVIESFQLLWKNGRWTVGLPGYYHPRDHRWRNLCRVSTVKDKRFAKINWTKYLTRAALEYCQRWDLDLETLKLSKEEEENGE